MARKALIDQAGTVVNVIEVTDGDFTPPDGCTLVDATDDAEPGGAWDGHEFTRAPAGTPPAAPPSREEFAAVVSALEDLTTTVLMGGM